MDADDGVECDCGVAERWAIARQVLQGEAQGTDLLAAVRFAFGAMQWAQNVCHFDERSLLVKGIERLAPFLEPSPAEPAEKEEGGER